MLVFPQLLTYFIDLRDNVLVYVIYVFLVLLPVRKSERETDLLALPTPQGFLHSAN
jgi:hypothetical protein